MAGAAGAQSGTTILQYAQTSDGQQILVPSNQVVVQGRTAQISCPIRAGWQMYELQCDVSTVEG